MGVGVGVVCGVWCNGGVGWWGVCVCVCVCVWWWWLWCVCVCVCGEEWGVA